MTRQQEGDESAPRAAHEWLEDALGRYQVTHIHSAIREALKALDKGKLPTPEETTLPEMDELLKKILDKSPEDEFDQGDMNMGCELLWELVGEGKVYKEKHRDALVRLCRRYVTCNRELKTVLDRESATTARFDAKITALEAERDALKADRDTLKQSRDTWKHVSWENETLRIQYFAELGVLRKERAILVESEKHRKELIDAVVGQETPQQAWERAFEDGFYLGREYGMDPTAATTFEIPPYTPPLKAGKE